MHFWNHSLRYLPKHCVNSVTAKRDTICSICKRFLSEYRLTRILNAVIVCVFKVSSHGEAVAAIVGNSFCNTDELSLDEELLAASVSHLLPEKAIVYPHSSAGVFVLWFTKPWIVAVTLLTDEKWQRVSLAFGRLLAI